ncbi:hypothetical protein JL720_12903 [Aureococcus anophagefferens]|nr:hypothetical protein JL720_12903 [Aureococcus anophagefferens]
MGSMLSRAAAPGPARAAAPGPARAVTPDAAAAPPEKRRRSGGADALTHAVGSAAVVTSVLSFSGYLTVLQLEACSWADEWREPGDVREGDVAALDLPPSLKPACLALAATERCGGDPVAVFSPDMEKRSGVLATHFDAFGTTIFPALAVLDDLAHPRDGEADSAAGAARRAAIASCSRPSACRP